MSRFRITSPSGADFGVWPGATAQDAWTALLVAVGAPEERRGPLPADWTATAVMPFGEALELARQESILVSPPSLPGRGVVAWCTSEMRSWSTTPWLPGVAALGHLASWRADRIAQLLGLGQGRAFNISRPGEPGTNDREGR